MIRLFASDLDGTLLNAQHTSDAVILSIAKRLQKAGYLLAASTGRSLRMIAPDELPGFYTVCMNGALVLDPNETILAESPIDPALIREMYEKFPEVPLEFCSKDQIYSRISRERSQAVNQAHRKPGSGLIPIQSIETFMNNRRCGVSLEELLAQPIYKVNALYTNDAAQQEFDQWLHAHEDVLVNAQSQPDLYEITMTGVNKAHGVRQLARALGIQEEECAVFGDGGNDLNMLEAFEASYAPCTGSPAAQAAARHVIGPYDEYSVIRTMQAIAEAQSVEPSSDTSCSRLPE